LTFPNPIIEKHNNIFVVRDDLIAGGTKSRYCEYLFQSYDHVVYATPAFGGAQVALALCAKLAGKRCTLFTAKRKTPHRRTVQAYNYGADVYMVPYGYLHVVQSKAKKFAKDKNAHYLEFGADEQQAINLIGDAGRYVFDQIGDVDEVWSASGSGVLTRGLQNSGVNADFHAVQVGKPPKHGKAKLHKYPKPFQFESKFRTPFPSCPNYDRKAWEYCLRLKGDGNIVFWNVMG
jgi:hypothetical protein